MFPSFKDTSTAIYWYKEKQSRKIVEKLWRREARLELNPAVVQCALTVQFLQNLSTVSVVCSASGPEDELEKWRLSGVECRCWEL